jgi:hypothetical protein
MIRNKARLSLVLAPRTPLTMKIFSLPKSATRSPRQRLQSRFRDSRTHHAPHLAHRMRVEETPAAQAFPIGLTNADVGSIGVFRIVISTHCFVIAINNCVRARPNASTLP